MNACIFNIQKFSIHDGPGIRSVVFFKGCPLHCAWCANPESQDFHIQVLYDSSKCTKCFSCIKHNKAQNITYEDDRIHVAYYDEDENYNLLCPSQALKTEGRYESIDEVTKEVLKDIDFYEESGGGITLSGGEVLSQTPFAIELCRTLKSHNLHIAIETTGFAPQHIFQQLIKEVDLLLFDMKHYDSKKHKEACGVSNEIIIENMKYATSLGMPIIARIPIIPNVNDSVEDCHHFCSLLHDIGITEVNLLPFHQFGAMKYAQLGISYPMEDVAQLHPEDIEHLRDTMINDGFNCTI